MQSNALHPRHKAFSNFKETDYKETDDRNKLARRENQLIQLSLIFQFSPVTNVRNERNKRVTGTTCN